jgi:hypothetical protein
MSSSGGREGGIDRLFHACDRSDDEQVGVILEQLEHPSADRKVVVDQQQALDLREIEATGGVLLRS